MVKSSLCLIKHHTRTEYGRVEVRLRAFLNSVLDGKEWSPSSPIPFIPGKWLPLRIGEEVGCDPEAVRMS